MNTEFKGTPGCWVANEYHISVAGCHPHGQAFVQHISYSIDKTKDIVGLSNAQLMATAPELLLALKALVEKCLRVADTTLMYDELYNSQQVIIKALNPKL